MSNIGDVYNERYTGDYREKLSGFEIARWQALRHFIPRNLGHREPREILDYGAGSGLHVELWEELFPNSKLHFCDLSSVAREKFSAKFPRHADSYRLLDANAADFPDASFDVIVSIEVMEHVEDLAAYLRDIHRLLRPGGQFFWTTPCGNALSVEHLYSLLTRQIQTTAEGYRRWDWEDPTHLRRLKSREIQGLLEDTGFRTVRFNFRAHFFSFVCTYCPPVNRFFDFRNKLMTFDYRWFRNLKNGASMLGCATKPGN